MSKWTEYTGSDEQIAELLQAKRFVVDSEYSTFNDPSTLNMPVTETYIIWLREILEKGKVAAYWIIPDDPLREMKVRQAQTGQPVWHKRKDGLTNKLIVICTTNPDWNLPKAEYSFTPFED